MTERARSLRAVPIVSAIALASAIGLAGLRGLASDHRDGPSTTGDPVTDITDVFAFMRPVAGDAGYVRSDHLVLMMTVHPTASAAATFDPGAEYFFNLAGAKPKADGFDLGVDVVVACRFRPRGDAGTQPFICSANGHFFAGETDVVSGDETLPLRVFAGRRADPAFGAIASVATTLAAGALPDGGADAQNDFANDAVLAIVAELDVDRVVFGDAGRRPIVVSSGTGRFE